MQQKAFAYHEAACVSCEQAVPNSPVPSLTLSRPVPLHAEQLGLAVVTCTENVHPAPDPPSNSPAGLSDHAGVETLTCAGRW